MAAIECKTEIPEVPGLKEAELTVGRDFLLVCEGEFPRDLVQEKLQFVLKPEQKYQIHFRGFEFRSPTVADIKITTYTPGSVQFQDLQISDGAQTLSLGPVSYQVQSVLPPPNPQEPAAKQEPFGPFGPAGMSVPALYWGILAAIVGLVLATVVAKIYRVLQRRNMLDKLKEHDSALSPLSQFHQSMRKLSRVNSVFFGVDTVPAEDVRTCLEQVDGMLRLFLTRRFRVPAMEWNDRLILQDLKKYNRHVFDLYGMDLKKLLMELRRAMQDKETVTALDALNIATQCRTLVEKMEAAG